LINLAKLRENFYKFKERMKKLTIVLAAITLVLSVNLFSQPKLTISVTGGYNVPLPDLKGDASSETDRDNTYLIKNGFNAGLEGKYAVDKKGMFRITLGGSYNSLKGEGSYFHTNDIEIHQKINIITAGLGAEYAFMPKGKANPFLGLDINGNFFSGELETIVTAPTTVDHDEEGTTVTKLHSASRVGLGIGGGVDFAFSKNVGALVGFKYNLANLIGKDYDSLSQVGEYNLNDKEHTHGTETIKNRNISFIQLYAGVSFYLMHPKKKMKK
jgi:opacity protein-like surface antigen